MISLPMAHIVHYALNALWQVPLLTVACFLAIRLLRPGLLTGHLLWIATLLLAVAVPFTGYEPPQPRVLPAQLPYEQASEAPGQITALATENPAPQPPAQPTAHPTSLLHPLIILLPALGGRLPSLLAAIYLLLTLAGLGRLLASAIAGRRLYRASSPAAMTTRQSLLVAQLTSYFELQAPLIRVPHTLHTGPLLTGLIEPAILIPATLLQADPPEFATVIAHELAHLRRRDLLVNLVLRVASLPIAFHPCTPLLHARIRHTRELLTDRLAASALCSPTAYAQSLLTLSHHLIATATPPLAAGLFERRFPFQGHSKPALEERIMKLIAPPAAPSRFPVRAARAGAAFALSAAALAAVSLLHLVPSALAAEQVATEPSTLQHPAVPAPTAPHPFTPKADEFTTRDDGKTRTATRTESTPTSVTRQVLTLSQDQPEASHQLQPSTPPAPPQAASPGDATSHSYDPARPCAPPVLCDSFGAPPVPPIPPPLSSFRMGISSAEAQAQARDLAKLQADMEKMSRELNTEVSAQLNPQMQASLEAMRKELESPEFRRQIAEATDAAAHVRLEHLDPELEQLRARTGIDTASDARREALREAFHQRVEDAKRKFRDQLKTAGGNSTSIEQASNQFSAEIQAATSEYASALLASTRR